MKDIYGLSSAPVFVLEEVMVWRNDGKQGNTTRRRYTPSR